MNILITGASGQIGSSLAKRLINQGTHELLLVDNFRNGNPDNLREGNSYIAPIIYCDVADHQNIGLQLSGYKFDAIIHLAAITSLPDCESNPAECFNVNVAGTANVLDFARKNNVSHVIFSSTSAVYENNTEEIFTEDLSVNPKLFYSQSKKMAEDLIDSYRNHYNMCITTLRLFNVFGPDGDSKRLHPPLLNHIVRELKKNKKVVLSGDGSQARDFIHISDIVSAITACLNKKPNTTINICSGQLTSVRAFAASTLCGLADYLGLKYFNIDYKPANNLWDAYPALFSGSFPLKKEIVTFEVNKRSLGSNKKAKEILDWSPNLNIHDLIRESAAECYHKI